jgi:hypothetical protein
MATPIIHLYEYGYLFCTACKSVIIFQKLNAHLAYTHHIHARLRKPTVAAFQAAAVAQTHDDIQPLPDGSPPLPFLAAPVPGYACKACNFKTTNWHCFRQHVRTVHYLYNKAIKKAEVACFLQAWCTLRNSYIKYWRVATKAADTSLAESLYPRNENAKLDPKLTALLEIEADEEARLASEAQEFACQSQELEHDENTDWLRGCGWPRWFAHKPLHIITSTAQTPQQEADLSLGSWDGIAWISSAQVEAVLCRLVQLTSCVLARCEETLLDTPRALRCWLRSWGNSFYAFPFELPQRAQTKQRYYLYFTRFVCYVFRAWQVCLTQEMDLEEVYSLALTVPQVEAMQDIWAEISGLEAEEPTPPALLEALYRLLVLFWTDSSSSSRLESKAIVNFSGVLGVHPLQLAYRSAYDYTPYLAALIWVGRLILLEYALPLRAYNTLPTPWPDRSAYPQMQARLCAEIRPQYLQRGSLSPVGYLIERLQHGRAIARREGARTNIAWSLNGEQLEIGGFKITMGELRLTVHHLLQRLDKDSRQLMLGAVPHCPLSSIKDDISKHLPGYSFLQEPANQMQDSFKLLTRRAFSKEGGFALHGKGKERALCYLKQCDKFVERLFAGIHLTSGMPARVEELRVIRWADTRAVPRNVFIYNGRLLLVFTYNKSSTRSNNSFYIVRVPCPGVERALFLYLAWIRPFVDLLIRQLKLSDQIQNNPHLFKRHADSNSCFTAAQALKALQNSTQKCPFPLNFALYRQIAVSIAKKHLPNLIQPFDAHMPDDPSGFLKLLSFQTGHNPITHASAYALDRTLPAKLQPELIARYIQNSQAWHQFMETTEKDQSINAYTPQGLSGLGLSTKDSSTKKSSTTRQRSSSFEGYEAYTSDQSDSPERVALLASFKPSKSKTRRQSTADKAILRQLDKLRRGISKLEDQLQSKRS